METALPDISPNLSADALPTHRIDSTLTFTLDDDESRKAWGNVKDNSMNTTVEFDGYVPTGMIQARAHKKRRINKKWLKRYGMKMGYQKVRGKMIDCRAEDFPNHVEISSNELILEPAP